VDGGTVLRQFYSQGFVDTDGTVLYYTKDHLGSIRELTDITQAVRARYDYDPYGRMTKVQGDRDSFYGFTGHPWHSQSGLNLAMFREYDPITGRWISRDPIGERGGVNLYCYDLNEPINSIDVSGLIPVHGWWCGPNWTGGVPTMYFPEDASFHKPPMGPVDWACKQHDICYYKCRKEKGDCQGSGLNKCFRKCDLILEWEAFGMSPFDPIGPVIGVGMLGQALNNGF
jgi:RHS repeat-associated protein